MTLRIKWSCILVVGAWSVMVACPRMKGAPSTGIHESNSVSVGASDKTGGAVEEICSLIYEGNFPGAAERLAAVDPNLVSVSEREALQAVMTRYRAIEQNRRNGRQAAFNEQWDRLDSFKKGKWPADINEPGPSKPNGRKPDQSSPLPDPNQGKVRDTNEVRMPKDVNAPADRPVDMNDPNSLTAILALVARVDEFADASQKRMLREDVFVKQTIQRAIDRASQFEFEGKWREAYTSCYLWLKALDPNNKGYSEYADQLLDKVMIGGSFEDSPCETAPQRYEGVDKAIFVRVVRILNLYYVNEIDFSQMAVKAIGRCRLLAEVLAVLPPPKASSGKGSPFYITPTREAVSAWSVALEALVDQVKQDPKGLRVEGFIDVFEKVLSISRGTVQLPDSILIAHFVEASLATLDPHTNLVWPKQVEAFNTAMTNEFTGIGVEISKPDGFLTITGLLLDTPAYKAGLDAGDLVDAVDGLPTKDMSLDCAVKKIKGPRGTPVNLMIRRPDQKEGRTVTLVRDRITVPTIRGWQRGEGGRWQYLVDPNHQIGLVRITGFMEQTAADLEKVLEELEGQGLKGLILDLRWNSGGLLNSAVEVADKFIKEGLIVKTQPGYGGLPTYELGRAEGTHPDYPMVVLVNSYSASASEIVAGALADPLYKRAVVVGERTHGKGSVQVIVDYRLDGAELKYTMAYYHLPSGQRVNSREDMEKLGRKDWGVTPGVTVELRTDEFSKLYDVQRDNDTLVQAGQNGKEVVKRHTVQELIDSDPQLATALLVVQSQLIEAGQWTP